MNSDQEAQSLASHDESRAAHERFAQNVRVEEAKLATPASTGQPNADDLALIARAQAHRDSEGRRLYEVNSGMRAHLESWRTKVFAGERLPAGLVAATLAKLEGKPVPEVAEVAEPQGTPIERAHAALEADGGFLDAADLDTMPAEVRSELTAGYVIDLAGPDGGYVLTREDLAQLHAARAAGIDQKRHRRLTDTCRRCERSSDNL